MRMPDHHPRFGRESAQERTDNLLSSLAGGARRYRLQSAESTHDARLGTHAVTVLWPNRAGQKPRLFVDAVEIRPEHLRVASDGLGLSWAQGAGEARRAGSLRFASHRGSGMGHVTFGATEAPVSIVTESHFRCTLSRNAGAVLQREQSLFWSEDSAAWKQATWSGEALRWTLRVVDSEEVGAHTREIDMSFSDLQTQVGWKAGRDGEDFASTLVDETVKVGERTIRRLRFDFSIDDVEAIAEDDRSGLAPDDRGIATVFPFLGAFHINQWADKLSGAIACKVDGQSVAYAVRGVADNDAIVGLYQLEGTRLPFLVHGEHLEVAGARAAVQRLGDELHWTGLPGHLAQLAGLPATGMLRFSNDGETVLEGGNGRRCSAVLSLVAERNTVLAAADGATVADTAMATVDWTARRLAAATAAPQLDLDALMNMMPYAADDKGITRDVVQEEVRGDLFQIIHFYMEPALRERYISQAPIELEGELRLIAEKGGKKDGEEGVKEVREFYRGLGTPYLAAAMRSQSSDKGLRKLNLLRAEQMLKSRISQSDIYAQQAPLLYARRFRMRFKEFADYLNDQEQNATAHAAHIATDAAKWAEEITRRLKAAPDQPTRDAFQAMLDDIKEVAAKGQDKRYWAYVVYRRVTREGFLNQLRLQLKKTKSMESLYAVQGVVTLLGLLDPSGYFARKFSETLQLFNLLEVLTGTMDLSANVDNLRKVMVDLIHKYCENPGAVQDEKVKEVLQHLQEYVNAKGTEKAATIVSGVMEVLLTLMGAGQAGTELGKKIWEVTGKRIQLPRVLSELAGSVAAVGYFVAWDLRNRFPRFASFSESALRTLCTTISRVVMVGMGAAGFVGVIVNAATGQWNTMTERQKAQALAVAVGMFAPVMVEVVLGSVELRAAYRVTGTAGGALKHWVGIEKVDARAIEGAYANSMARYLVGTTRASQAAASAMATVPSFWAKHMVEPGAIKRLLGAGLRRVATWVVGMGLAIFNLVTSAMDLKDAKTTEEKVLHSFMVAGAILDILAISFDIAAFVVGATTLGTVLSAMSMVFGALAILAAIGGIITLIIIFTRPRPTAVEEFLGERARAVGLEMPHEASIENLAIKESLDRKQVLVRGLGLQVVGDANGFVTISDTPVQPAQPVEPPPPPRRAASLGAAKNDHHTVLGFLAEGDSGALLYAQAPHSGALLANFLLTAEADGTVGFVGERLPGNDASRQVWTVEVTGGVEMDQDKTARAAQAHISVQVGGQVRFLCREGDALKVSGTPFLWCVSVQDSKPEALTVPARLDLQVSDRELNIPLGLERGDKVKWIIRPALPSFLRFLEDSGTITQVPDTDPSPMPATSYTVTVSNELGSLDASFQLSVA
ncbi:hypothetical protein D187_000774 [Cystobacter fuscus DSM 2262]|uniref:Uncharacterized protein n=1 Tax=Cystobacter fuscus (strain ATCC 25194 / DSM 2262 / NBRC 100088 / M29) TaxID=1242864 RepID=S9R8B9_CYSF2|nr:hypothetical protein [Cystobacter fuscus]EPX65348.1 hypothetical protein D187_000774 [Cystobacter fuscus DSM 2262]